VRGLPRGTAVRRSVPSGLLRARPRPTGIEGRPAGEEGAVAFVIVELLGWTSQQFNNMTIQP
jgi:hypothetical protein